ncbi:FUSC family protein [Aggregicoccus sp. 17bor-14]|uniref:FUSC family protein n=1 Tax=Myxococcaceae TaxID=31 RepID=UPI00129C5ACC|nr:MULTISPECIES: FUSC family protein [Myxococcaceae]MBF5046612.1 FUSC family protein [Simulacricoccus sp. 17bor-14]MRI92322.1 FUSC family protein [Aggregicoccus sp. 17bor-14]
MLHRTPSHRLLRHLRALVRLEPGRPALWAGLRAALATVLPLALAQVFAVPGASWAALSGLLVTLADKGGSYRARAEIQGTLTLVGALAGALAAPAGTPLWLDAAALLLGVTAAGFARSYGETAGSVGGAVAVIFVVSLGSPAAGLEAAATRGLALLLGGTWAMTLSLVLWPLRPYLPARRAVAAVYRALAAAAEDLGRLTRDAAAPEAWAEAQLRHRHLRPLLEAARATLAATRLGRAGESRRGAHLLVLLELAEPMLAALLALAGAMEAAPPQPAGRARVQQLGDAYAAMARWVASALVRARNEGMPREAPRPLRRAQPASYGAPPIREPEVALAPHVTQALARLREYAGVAHETTAGLLHGDPVSARGRRSVGVPQRRRRALLQPLRDNLRPESLVLRHALRTGLVATATLLLSRALGMRDAHWVTLTAVGVLQPYAASTEERALQRLGGIVLGASLAALLATHLHSPTALIAVIALLTTVSVALLPLNFAAFQVLLTPDYLLLATLGHGQWLLAEQRVVGVLLAGALSLAGTWFLWPSPERRRFPEAAAGALRAHGAYLREVAHAPASPALHAARRRCGLALQDAEASFQRLLAEYRGSPKRLEPGMALLTYARRLTSAVTALDAAPQAPAALQPLAQEAGGALETLAEALRRGQAPPPLPRLPVPEGRCGHRVEPAYAALLERLPRQLGILHRAVSRLGAEAALLR